MSGHAAAKWPAQRLRPAEKIGYLHLVRVLFQHYPGPSVLVAALMITQSFLYKADESVL